MKNLVDIGKTFDVVILSLILCHPLSDDKEERDEIIKEIMNDVTSLSGKYVIVAICNPLYSNRPQSQLQERFIGQDFNYSNENKIIKKIKSSGGERDDYHRPISYYTELFEYYGLKILRIDQSCGMDPQEMDVIHSDFMTFLLEVN